MKARRAQIGLLVVLLGVLAGPRSCLRKWG